MPWFVRDGRVRAIGARIIQNWGSIMRLVVFSDLHLDTTFRWAPATVARRRRQGLRDTLARIVELADEVDADAILCAGDLYEHERFTPDTVAFVESTFNEAGRPVFVAPGNHDYLCPGSLYVQARWSDTVHVFRDSSFRAVPLSDGVTLWGAAHRAPANTPGFFDRNFRVKAAGVHLALFHGSERSGLPFQEEGKRPHAPFDAAQIGDAGLHHAFVGHHHRRKEHALLTYPGNPEPLSFGEDGTRGAVVADVEPDGSIDRQWHDVSTSTMADVTVNVSGCPSRQQVRDRVVEAVAGATGCVRVTLQGELAPDVELRLTELTDVAPHLDVLVPRRGQIHVGYDLEEIAEEHTVRGQFVRDVMAAEDLDDEQRERIVVTGLRALEGRDDLEVA